MPFLEPLLLALLLPVVLTITPRTLPLLLILPALALRRRRISGHFIPRTPLNTTLLLLLGAILLNLFFTVDIALTLPHFAGALYGIALFFAVVSFARLSPRHYDLALLAYLLFSIILAALALLATNWQTKLPLIGDLIPRLPGSAAALALVYLPTAFWIQLLGISDVAAITEPATLGLDSRIEIWQRAVYLIQDFPLTGADMNTFDPVVRTLYPLFIAGPQSPINHAHNHLLQAGVDLGILALITALATPHPQPPASKG